MISMIRSNEVLIWSKQAFNKDLTMTFFGVNDHQFVDNGQFTFLKLTKPS